MNNEPTIIRDMKKPAALAKRAIIASQIAEACTPPVQVTCGSGVETESLNLLSGYWAAVRVAQVTAMAGTAEQILAAAGFDEEMNSK